MTDVSSTPTTGQVVWFELPAQDTGRAQGFYGDLLGWQFAPFGDEDYHVTEQGNGAIHAAQGEQRGLLAYFGVDDIEASRARVAELGGRAGEILDMPGIGRYAVCADTEGNPFGLYQDGAPA